MEVLYIVLPLSLLFSALAVGVFVWAAKNGQFDDLDTPAMRALFDEKKHNKKVHGLHGKEGRKEEATGDGQR